MTSSGQPRTARGKGEAVSQVCYKNPERSDTEVYVFADAGGVEKWRKDKSIPMVDVLQNFDVYESDSGGSTGLSIRPSKQTLESIFGTSNEDNVIREILEQGVIKGSSTSI
ncbi:MAG: ribosome maturation protein [Piptocephalis tieghemiana]|nr:MAG: ribosome maturation protein [Piptocephalis tieghemiana]